MVDSNEVIGQRSAKLLSPFPRTSFQVSIREFVRSYFAEKCRRPRQIRLEDTCVKVRQDWSFAWKHREPFFPHFCHINRYFFRKRLYDTLWWYNCELASFHKHLWNHLLCTGNWEIPPQCGKLLCYVEIIHSMYWKYYLYQLFLLNHEFKFYLAG